MPYSGLEAITSKVPSYHDILITLQLHKDHRVMMLSLFYIRAVTITDITL